MGSLSGSLSGITNAAKGKWGNDVKGWLKNTGGAADPISYGLTHKTVRENAADPLDLFENVDQEVAPTPAAVQEMPVTGDAASRAANRNKRAAMQARGGRASTIITGSRLGD